MNFLSQEPQEPQEQAKMKLEFCMFLGPSQRSCAILHVPRTVLKKGHFCTFLRTVLEKVSCFDAPTRLGTKGADLRGISNINLPFLVNQSFLVQKQNYKLAFRKLTKRQVEAIQTCLPSCYRHPNQASVNRLVVAFTKGIKTVCPTLKKAMKNTEATYTCALKCDQKQDGRGVRVVESSHLQ